MSACGGSIARLVEALDDLRRSLAFWEESLAKTRAFGDPVARQGWEAFVQDTETLQRRVKSLEDKQKIIDAEWGRDIADCTTLRAYWRRVLEALEIFGIEPSVLVALQNVESAERLLEPRPRADGTISGFTARIARLLEDAEKGRREAALDGAEAQRLLAQRRRSLQEAEEEIRSKREALEAQRARFAAEQDGQEAERFKREAEQLKGEVSQLRTALTALEADFSAHRLQAAENQARFERELVEADHRRQHELAEADRRFERELAEANRRLERAQAAPPEPSVSHEECRQKIDRLTAALASERLKTERLTAELENAYPPKSP